MGAGFTSQDEVLTHLWYLIGISGMGIHFKQEMIEGEKNQRFFLEGCTL